jgi:hypothetical protein
MLKPLQGSSLNHTYVCVNQGGNIICGSFNPNGSMFGSPGENDPGHTYDENACQPTYDTCVEDCIATIAQDPSSYPWYSVTTYNCHDWTKDVEGYCKSVCSQ